MCQFLHIAIQAIFIGQRFGIGKEISQCSVYTPFKAINSLRKLSPSYGLILVDM